MNPEPESGSPGSSAKAAAPDRTFEHEGVTWTVHVGGVGVAGTGRFAAPGLQLMRFARDGALEPEREIVMSLRDPADLYDTELVGLLLDSRPVESRPDDGANDPPARQADRLESGDWG